MVLPRAVRVRVVRLSSLLALLILVWVVSGVSRRYVALGQPAGDVMQQKLQQAIDTLTTPGLGDGQYEQGFSEGLESLFTSNLVVLPTMNVPEAGNAFGEHQIMAQDLLDALNQHIDGANLGSEDTKKAAAEVRNFIQLTEEAMQVIGEETGHCGPGAGAGAACQALQADDEGGTFDTVEGFAREVRSPFFLAEPPLGDPVEDAFVPEGLSRGECVPIVKETRGVKTVVRSTTATIWNQPWIGRSELVGLTDVWVFEFVPAEFVKVITLCNQGGRNVTMSVQMDIIRERPLMHLWRFLGGA